MVKGHRRKGEGSFSVKPSGNLEYKFRYTDEYGRRKTKSVSGVSERHCYERAEQFLYQLEQKLRFIDYDATITQLLREKIEKDYQKNYIGEQGYDRYLKTLGIIERSAMGHMSICDIQEYNLECFYHELKRYSNHTIRRVNSMIKSAFDIAMRKSIISINLMNELDYKCPKSDKKDKKVRGMTEEEQRRFVETLNKYRVQRGYNSYKLQLLIEMYSGMRMGEINALKPGDINFSQGFIHVCRTVSVGRNNRSFIKESAKTAAGERDVPISKPLEKVLRQALDEMKENEDGLIFYDYRNNSVVNTNQVNGSFRTICKKANVPYHGQHSLRHTFATRCIEAGVPALVLKKWLGHTNIHITLDTYADVFDRMNFRAINKFEVLREGFM